MPDRLPEASRETAPASGPPVQVGQNKWLVLSTVGLGTFFAVLDGSVVNVSLPTITRELHTDLTTIQWVVMAYLLTITGLLLTFGRLADLIGRKKIYVAGMVVFTLGTLLCGLSQNIGQLIAFRAVQGVGSAMSSSISAALTASAFPIGERGKALGLVVAGMTDREAVALQSFVGGFQDAFVVSAAICSIGVLTSLVRGSGRAAMQPAIATAGAPASTRGDIARG